MNPAEVVANRRFLLCAGTPWMVDIAKSLAKTFGPMDYSLPTKEAPDWVFWLLSFVSEYAREQNSNLGRQSVFDTTPTKQALGIEYRPIDETLSHMGSSLVMHGIVKKTASFKPTWTEKEALQTVEQF